MYWKFAGDEQAVLISVGMGLDESLPLVLRIKKILIEQNCSDFAKLTRQYLNAEIADEVRRIVADFSA